MFGWSLILRCYEIFPNNNIFFHLKKVLSLCPLTSLSCTLKLPVTAGQALFGFASRNESNYSMGFGLMANTFCYYLRNMEHVPLISGSFKKSNRKTEPNLPKYLCAAVPRDVLKSSPQLPLRSRVPVLEHVGLLLGSAGMLGPQAKCDSAQGKSLLLGSRPVLGGGGSHREFSFKRSQILILKHVSCAKGDLRSLKKMTFSFLAFTPLLLLNWLWAGLFYPQKTLPARAVCCFLWVDELSWSRGARRGGTGSEMSPFGLIGPANQFGVCGAGAALAQCCSDQTSPALRSSAESLSHRCLQRTNPTIPTPVAGTSLPSWGWSSGGMAGLTGRTANPA